MKKRLLKFILPISLGLTLSMLTFFAFISTTFISYDPFNNYKCTAVDELKGTDGNCYACTSGCHVTYTHEGIGCTDGSAGVYCCPNGGGGSTGCQTKTIALNSINNLK